MALPDQGHFSLNTFSKDLRKKVCEACLFIGYVYTIGLKREFLRFILNQDISIFTKREEYYPHILIG